MIAFISLDSMDTFSSKLEVVNKKLLKFNEKIEILSISKEFNNYHGKKQLCNKVVLSDIKQTKINNVEFVGHISFKNDSKAIYTQTNIDLSHIANDKNITCQHCDIKRHRLSYNVFLVDGQLKTIGSSCSENYFGIDIERILSIYTTFFESLEEDEFKQNYSKYISMSEIISAVNVATLNYKSAWIKEETMLAINAIINDNKYAINDTIVSNTKKLLVSTYKDIDTNNNFNFNIYNAIFETGALKEYISVKQIGLLCWAIWKVNQINTKIETIVSNFIGTINDKITFTATITNYVIFENQFGYQALVELKEDNGNLLKCYTATSTKLFDSICDNIGKTYNFKATVKNHEIKPDFKTKIETKKTIVTRLAII